MKKQDKLMVVIAIVVLILLIHNSLNNRENERNTMYELDNKFAELEQRVEYNNAKIAEMTRKLDKAKEIAEENQRIIDENADIIQWLNELEVGE